MRDSRWYILVLFTFFVIIAFLDSDFSKIGVVGIVLTTAIYFLPYVQSKYESKCEEYNTEEPPENKQDKLEEYEENTIAKDVNLPSDTIMSLIFIDNFTEVLDTVEEIRIPILLALIDRKINTLAQQLDGVVRKFEKDEYLFVFSSDKLEYLKQKRFSILDQVREIDMGNTIPVTLSIGIGINSANLSQSMIDARAALDLALSRGGDQVVIKDNHEYIFFGGKSKEIDTNTKVRARVKAQMLSDLIIAARNVVVMGHRNADLDSFGACVGIYKISSVLDKHANIVLKDVTGNTSELHNRLLLEKEYQKNVFVNDKEALTRVDEHTLLIIVDVHTPSIVEMPELLNRTKKIVVFDHHRKSASFIKDPILTYHEPYASSTCELITEMLSYVKAPIKLNPVEADALLAGITVDTKGFKVKTGVKTFEAAAYLRKNGADSIRVTGLFKEHMESYIIKTHTVSNAYFFRDNIAISVCGATGKERSVITAQAADELLTIYGVEASFVLCPVGNKVYISARSIPNVNVQVILEKLGGGGHQTVAGAQLSDIDIDEAKQKVEKAIEKYLLEVG